MNFAHMPELQWRWSYFVLWCVLILVEAFMLVSLGKSGYNLFSEFINKGQKVRKQKI